MESRLDRLKNDPRIKYVAGISGDRHIIEIELSDIKIHPKLQKIRGSQPKSIAILKSSIKEVSGNDSLYPITLYVPHEHEGDWEFYIADGAQRYNALVSNEETKTFAQVVLRWTLADAMEAGISSNFARFKMDESDIFSIMDTSTLGDREIMRATDYEESTVARIRKVHEVRWLRTLVDKPKRALPYTRAAKLVAACGKDDDRLAALKLVMDEILESAETNAAYYEQQGKSRRMTKKDAKKTTIKFWFDEKKDRLDVVANQLDTGKIEQDTDGVWRVIESASSGNVAVVVGMPNEWEKRPAISNFFNVDSWDKLTREDVEKVRKALPKVDEYLAQQIKRMTPDEPMTSSFATYVAENEPAVSKPPKTQEPTLVPGNDE